MTTVLNPASREQNRTAVPSGSLQTDCVERLKLTFDALAASSKGTKDILLTIQKGRDEIRTLELLLAGTTARELRVPDV